MSELTVGQAGWSPDYKSPEDFRAIAKNLRAEGQSSRADAMDFLIEKAKRRRVPDPRLDALVEAAEHLVDVAFPLNTGNYPLPGSHEELENLRNAATRMRAALADAKEEGR